MESDIFKAGVRPGSPDNEGEVKVMLCYVLSKTQPMSIDQLYDALSQHGLINYFELVRALEKLTQSGHLSQQLSDSGGALYTATGLGIDTGKELESLLPPAVREKAVKACRLLLAREQRLREVGVSQTPCEGGFILELTLPDPGGADLLTLRVFVPTQKECELLKRRFLNAPLTVYKGIMALLTGNEQVLGQIFTHEQSIF